MPTARYDDLRALFINCTLKRSPELSHTGGLIELSRADRRGFPLQLVDQRSGSVAHQL